MIPDNTLGNWVMQADKALLPLEEALHDEIIKAAYVPADETPVKVLTLEKKAYMRCYLSPLAERRLMRFRFALSHRGEVVENDLEAFKGLLQNDGYAGYNSAG